MLYRNIKKNYATNTDANNRIARGQQFSENKIY